MESTEPTQLILAAFDRLNCTPLKLWDLKVATNLPLNDLQKYLKEMISRDELFSENISGKSYYFSREQLQTVQKGIENRLEEYHKKYPGRPGLAETEIVSQLEKFYPHEATRRAAQYGIQQKRLRRDKQYLRLTSFTPTLSAKETDAYRRLEESYRTALFTPPTIKEAMAQLNISAKEFKELIKLMRDEGTLIYVDETLLFHHIVFAKIKQMLRDYFNKKGEITVAEFKDLTGTTRKHSIPLLEYLDKTGITEREGDVRKAGAKLDKIMDD
ncbi:MAG: hypothetical protein GWN61_01890 [candidate division Zixibacteria bacterium]|nr:hypothetical protein [candidate division Zixibacteria bacterium]NIX54823.1 hypothetical protein [candidate division Zixibacteria bacterium]